MMMGNGWMGLMWLWWLLILAGLGVVMYVVIRMAVGARDGAPEAGGSARRILDERNARGEIEDEEYRRRRGQLP
jgi:putative membrane protein